MARIKLSTGLCPVCGRMVARTLSTHHGLMTESYHCPQHGRRESNPTGVSVADWVAAPTMPALGEILGMAVAIR